jgi:hypothetical protein
MDIIELKPQYSFDTPDEDVVLADKEKAVITFNNNEYKGVCTALLHLGRKPCVRFNMPLESFSEYGQIMTSGLHGKAELNLPERDITVENGYIHRLSGGKSSVVAAENEHPSISWESSREPFTVLGDSSTDIDNMIFHLFNCPILSQLNGTQPIGKKGWTSISVITLKWKSWVIEFKSVPSHNKVRQHIKEEGGFGLTHVGFIKKDNDGSFTNAEVHTLIYGFSRFMDFVVGRTCHPCLCTGYKKGQKVYEEWGANFSSWGPETWATGLSGSWKPSETLEVLFPLFMDLFCEKDTQKALNEVILWYLSTTEPGRPMIDQIIILLQAGIERLSYEYTVNYKKLMSKRKFDKSSASDNFRTLFSSLGIPLEIPKELNRLIQQAERLNWENASHALTGIRNIMVHPDPKKKSQLDNDVYYDVWRLGIEYLELSILAFCGYSGKYCSRIKGRNTYVPWRKESD